MKALFTSIWPRQCSTAFRRGSISGARWLGRWCKSVPGQSGHRNQVGTDKRIRVLYYCSAPRRKILGHGFYGEEVAALGLDARVASVDVTNSLRDVMIRDYDAVISYFYSYSAIAAVIAQLRGKRILITGGAEQILRAMAPGPAVYILRLAGFFLSLLFCTRILATSTSDFDTMRRLAFFKRGSIGLAFHGCVAASQLDPADFQRARASASMITICGMDSPDNLLRKGVLRSIDLLAATRKHHPDAQLTVLGRDTFGHMARDHSQKLGCQDAVIFKGFVSEAEKFKLLRQTRFYLQLSEYEGFGVGALEALALGCTVVHSNVGGLSDTIAHYGVVRNLSEQDALDPNGVDRIADWTEFQAHMAQFQIERRAAALINALG